MRRAPTRIGDACPIGRKHRIDAVGQTPQAAAIGIHDEDIAAGSGLEDDFAAGSQRHGAAER